MNPNKENGAVTDRQIERLDTARRGLDAARASHDHARRVLDEAIREHEVAAAALAERLRLVVGRQERDELTLNVGTGIH
ncbi:hypothetical protein FSW04_20150 [Baekduia soli]|uniref:Uncharacterized protein n=1 Tax=Baekduia soli TaxID=496014 RepID=A0A5B8U9D8_9ACTN|nr:hypothetical protein [Baekduia soli]QEC49660.1 hypothetical protein FSW04_20150 [Baekduia soli]